jgi:hypothetical protein
MDSVVIKTEKALAQDAPPVLLSSLMAHRRPIIAPPPPQQPKSIATIAKEPEPAAAKRPAAGASTSTRHSVDRLESTIAASRSVPQTPRTPGPGDGAGQQQQQLTTTDRAALRGSASEKKFYQDIYAQSMKWLQLAKTAQNFVATSVTAETAVEMAREAGAAALAASTIANAQQPVPVFSKGRAEPIDSVTQDLLDVNDD